MRFWQAVVIFGLIVGAPLGVGASGDSPAAEAKGVSRPVYRPPLRGAPAGRVGGGTRGATDRESFSLLVLAPDHVGYTVSEQPCLYWFISKPTSYPVEFTLTERGAVSPLLEKTIAGPETGGIQGVCLADQGVRLRKGVPFKWFVTLVTDAEHRSKDILAGGIVEQVDPPSSLDARLKAADKGTAAYVYAEEGLWYDALGALSESIASAPGDRGLREERAALLEQVGLAEAAEAERRTAVR